MGAGVIEELWATKFIILIGSKSQSHTPSCCYVEDVPIEQAQPSNGDPKWHVKTHGQVTIPGVRMQLHKEKV